MRRFLLLPLFLFLLFSCESAEDVQQHENVEEYNLTWGSSSVGSQGYVIIEAMASNVDEHVPFDNSSVSTAGGPENMQLIEQNEIELGQSTSDVLYSADNGLDPFNEPVEFTQILAYGYWSLPILAPENSDIETVEDLSGETLNVGEQGGSSAIIIDAVLEEYGLTDEVDYEYLNNDDAADAMEAGQIDATVLFHMDGDITAGAFEELAQSTEFRPIEFDEEVLESVSETNEGIEVEVTSEDAFDFYDEDTIAPGNTGQLVTSPDLDEEVVYELTKHLVENYENIQEVGPELSAFDPDYATEGLVDEYPVHPGAVQYYEEEGMWD